MCYNYYGDTMNKIQGQEMIIESIKNLYKSKGSISNGDIYDILTTFNLSDQDRLLFVKKNVFDRGEYIEKGIITDPSISFIPMASSYVCDKEKSAESIKMYISVDASHLKKTYEKINDFLNKNKISSNSKARNRATSDDIVIRIPDISDIEKVRDFIRKDSYIKDAIKFTNPFFAKDELGISYSMDGMYTSVNNELSYLLEEYFNSNIDHIDDLNRDGFKEYLHSRKTEFYKNNNTLYPQEQIRISNLIELSMNEDFDYDDMIMYFQIMKEIKNSRASIPDIMESVYNDLKENCGEKESMELITNIDKVHDSLFKSPINCMLAKLYLTDDLVSYYIEKSNELEENKSL